MALTSQILLSSEGVKWHTSKQINSVISSSDEGMTETKQGKRAFLSEPRVMPTFKGGVGYKLQLVTGTCHLSLGISQLALVIKNPPANVGDAKDEGLIPGSGRSPGVGNGTSLQYSCLENSMDRGAWWATVHGVTKSWI